MARTTRSTVNQNTLGIVPEAVLPTDPVPLSQSGGGSNTLWFATQGIVPVKSVSQVEIWIWNCQYNIQKPFNIPFTLRLKELHWNVWDHSTIRLNVDLQGGGIKGFIEPGQTKQFDILFTPPQLPTFRTDGFLRQGFRWQLAARWEIVSTAPTPMEVLSNMAPEMPDIESERIQEPLYQSPDQLAAPVESQKTNRLAAWIRRRWK